MIFPAMSALTAALPVAANARAVATQAAPTHHFTLVCQSLARRPNCLTVPLLHYGCRRSMRLMDWFVKAAPTAHGLDLPSVDMDCPGIGGGTWALSS